METLDEAYAEACSGQSDINEHATVLCRLAAQCRRVTEFGVRDGVSSVALLAGLAAGGGRLVSYDKDSCGKAVARLKELGGDRFRFVRGDSLEVAIEPTELLLIDTQHTGRQLFAELSRHAARVSRWIALHDTVEFGPKGDDGGEGMYSGLCRFLLERPWWRVARHYPNQHGLTVLTTMGEYVGDS